MFRVVLYLLLAILIISLLRSVLGVIGKAVSAALEPTPPRNAAEPGGELKRDPVCGTYISTVTSVKKSVGKDTIHFCSTACRDKYESGRG